MDTVSEINEIWSVPAERAEEYFRQKDTAGCEVTVEALEPRRLGSLVFPRCRIRIRGEERERVWRGFVTAFMSAGG